MLLSNPDMQHLGEFIVSSRKNLRLNRGQLADDTCLCLATISRIENGKAQLIHKDTCNKLAYSLGCNPDALWAMAHGEEHRRAIARFPYHGPVSGSTGQERKMAKKKRKGKKMKKGTKAYTDQCQRLEKARQAKKAKAAGKGQGQPRQAKAAKKHTRAYKKRTGGNVPSVAEAKRAIAALRESSVGAGKEELDDLQKQIDNLQKQINMLTKKTDVIYAALDLG